MLDSSSEYCFARAAKSAPLFAFASYNAGPGKIAKMRKLAEKRGYDPNKWLNNVEIVTAQKIGLETTTYVRNIFKYYAAYKLSHEANAAQRKAHIARPLAQIGELRIDGAQIIPHANNTLVRTSF